MRFSRPRIQINNLRQNVNKSSKITLRKCHGLSVLFLCSNYPKLLIISRVTNQSFVIDEDGTITYYNNGLTCDGITFVYVSGGKWNVTSTTTRSIALRDLQNDYTVNLNLVANVQNSFTRDSPFACFL